jgi:two-component system LytT family response regulator
MNQLRTIIVDDEDMSRENLAWVLKEHCPEIDIVGTASNAQELLKEINIKSPDLVFLDVEMPEKTGLEAISEIRNRSFQVIVVTGKKEYGISAIKENVTDYILKPLDEDEVVAAVQKAVAKYIETKNSNFKSKILFHIQSGFKVLEVKDIIYLEGKDNYTEVYFGKESLLVAKTLKDYDKLLNQGDFYRLHKKYLVNLQHIKEFSYVDGGFIILSNGKQLSIPRTRLKDFINRMKNYAISTQNN